MEVIGNNIANVNTPRYSRQEAVLATLPEVPEHGPYIGQGVRLHSIEAIRNKQVEDKLRGLEADVAGLELAKQLHGQIEEMVNDPTEGGINALTARLFNNFELLAARPQDSAVRIQLVNDAQRLATRINQLDTELDSLRRQLRPEIEDRLDVVNDLLKQLAEVNKRILWMEQNGQGRSANQFIDESNRLLSELSKQVKVEVTEDENHVRTIHLNGEILVSGEHASTLRVGETEPLVLEIEGGACDKVTRDAVPRGGELGALFSFYNEKIPAVREEFDLFARGLIRAINSIHAEGIGLNGRYTYLTSEIPVEDTNGDGDRTNDLLLENEGIKIQPKAGFLHITVVNENGEPGTIQRHEIPIEPAKDTLGSIAAKLDAIDGITATADRVTGLLRIMADPGFSFDFAKPTDLGNLVPNDSTSPRLVLGGEYTGKGTDQYTFSVITAEPAEGEAQAQVGRGTITLQVTDQEGNLVKVLNLGAGYIPGQEVELGNGLKISVGQGVVAAGTSLSTPVYSADTDTSEILPALGINGLFKGQGAGDIGVSERIASDPRNIAHALSNNPGDAGNALRLSSLFEHATDIPEFAPRVTIAGTFQNFVQKLGQDTLSIEYQEDTKRKAMEATSALRESISGVSIDEEVVNLLRFQQMFQASARHITAMNQLLQILYNL